MNAMQWSSDQLDRYQADEIRSIRSGRYPIEWRTRHTFRVRRGAKHVCSVPVARFDEAWVQRLREASE